ncbi:tyrosine-type recombinase/integrase [Mycobacterium sp.]|uniref:tyrosine-type recombinase/integrase n=1 Tax=Mycobacterium sp. TaxID=1785 RepID=UPI0039C9BE3C
MRPDKAISIDRDSRGVAALARGSRLRARVLRSRLSTSRLRVHVPRRQANSSRFDPAAVRPTCCGAELPRITFHDLRHSYATGALRAGVSPKIVSERIGHANIGFFLETYAHVLENDDREAAE